ncbi:MAG: acetyl-CoA carboxylase biotin carboxylase subunit [Chloroflexi bacterium]|uniref:Biotin carboxylase n=1 Tax=Candidatus Chlorohelix allophototropha TaxID=3003348 RepID=A0A8T7M8T8_9CHLR|nr:acetyl-CoA carboxylase biotin carboxylase subunit [Chloroflexota bacterium]WJW68507.1 acetyl-CoA carboxylase biotin carboxylase subunit [Chloroflexota bacterium L227-S17]
MFKKILIANRGEIALRVVRACRDLGIPSVVAYSEADRDSLAVRLADEAICVGPAQSAKSYLHTPSIISAALITGADALHPGYGFLSENPYVAEICERVGITFIGPSPTVMEKMSEKTVARKMMQDAGLPITPGSEGALPNLDVAKRVASQIGYPVMLKALAGGGGRGIRIIESESDLERVFPLARAEADKAFSSGELYLEKYIPNPRHIEIQILADNYGNVIHLGERDCSIQRRYQKIMEEAPAPNLTEALRAKIGAAAVIGAKAIGYTNAGTIEFLLANTGEFYFMEMNTRIQVEHGVTEEVTGIDLVKWQIRIAAGERLTLSQKDIKIQGYAIECRVNAEDPANNFRPDAGTISLFVPPGGPGIRVDSHLYSGYTAPAYYDSLLGKIIAKGSTREEALTRLERALHDTVINGVKTTIPFQLKILGDEEYRAGRAYLDFVDKKMSGGW